MIIRTADAFTDTEQLIAAAWDFVARADFADLLSTAEEFEAAVIGTVEATDVVETTVAEHEGRIVAALAIRMTPYMWSRDKMYAEELWWWAATDAPASAAMRVFHHAKKRAKERAGDKEVIGNFKLLTTSPARVADVYVHAGLRQVETAFVGVL